MEKKIVYATVGVVIIIGVIAAGWYLTRPKVITLEHWTGFAGETPQEVFWSWAAEEFHKRHPNVEIVVSHYTFADFKPKLASSMAAGTPPDIFMTHGGGLLKAMVDEGQVADLTDLLSEDWAVAQIPEGVRVWMDFYDRIYGMPLEKSACAILANVRLFEEAGVPIPNPDEAWTWEEFLNVCSTFKAAGMTPLVTCGAKTTRHLYFLDFLFERIGGQERFIKTLNNEPGYSFEDEAYLQAYELFADLVAMEPFQEGWETADYGIAMGDFETEKGAMWLIFPWPVHTMIEDNPELELTYIRFPIVPGGSGGMDCGVSVCGWAVAEASEHKEEAFEWLRFLSTEEALIEYTKTGDVLAQIVEIPPETYHGAVEVSRVMGLMDTTPVLRKSVYAAPEWETKFEEVNKAVMFGEMTPEEACAELEAATETS